MVESAKLSPAHDLDALLSPLRALKTDALTELGGFSAEGRRHGLSRFRFLGPNAGHEPVRLGLFAGVHGDEPAGCTALVEFATAIAADPKRATGYELFIYPIVNPTGYERGTRENHTGFDLNREFWRGSNQEEVRLIESELRTHAFDGIITLHADDTCEGLYGYSHGRVRDELLLRPALVAAERVLPRDQRAVIDGFAAREGMIGECFQGVLSPPPDQEPQPFNLIFETPARAPFDHQVLANVAALDAIVAHYRGFIAYAQGL